MSLKMIESFLEKEMGLSAESIGPKVIAKAVRLRMADLGLPNIKGYYDYLKTSENERGILIEGVVVLETWFFRNNNAFAFLVNHVTEKWLPKHREAPLRVLSVPCSTGEEPYSIAMALMDAGIKLDQFRIDGVDISEVALGPKDLSGVTTCHSGNAILSQKATCISWTALFKKQSTSSKEMC
ncbi:MAG: hypothetical protein JRL30_29335 [Deltaproteobacteria bacterium]|nr:hypothetical protein [Deltaproteobacteria bacterium]